MKVDITREFILVDNWMSDEDIKSYNQEFYQMFDHSREGVFRKEGQYHVDKTFKSRLEFDVHAATTQLNLQLSHIWNRYIWSEQMRKVYSDAGGIFPYMNFSNHDFLLGAFYGPGDFYKPHRDTFLITCVFFHQDENNFVGGDFYLGSKTDLKDENLSYQKIDYKNNRLVIFPSRYVHYVGTVEQSLKPGVDGMRLCTQDFIDIIEYDR